MNYDINYNDQRFVDVENQKQNAINESNSTYDSMIQQSDKYYQNQIDAANKYAEEQKNLQQERTDFAIEQINQQKEQAQKDYTKEQSGAYVDWQKQSNQYGTNAEQIAASGLNMSGYSESSQVSMYNTYQNRISTARESYNQAVLNYNNAIKDAQLQNNSILAEIAYNALQAQLELSLQGFQYKNQLILDKQAQQRELDNTYYQRYQNVLSQINNENALKEQIRQYETSLAEQQRQYNESLAFQKQKAAQEQANWEKEYALSQASLAARSSGGSLSSKSSGNSSNTTVLTNQSSGSSFLDRIKSLANSAASVVKKASSSNITTSAKGVSTTEYNQILNAAKNLYTLSKGRNGTAAIDDFISRTNLSDAQIKSLYNSLGIK